MKYIVTLFWLTVFSPAFGQVEISWNGVDDDGDGLVDCDDPDTRVPVSDCTRPAHFLNWTATATGATAQMPYGGIGVSYTSNFPTIVSSVNVASPNFCVDLQTSAPSLNFAPPSNTASGTFTFSSPVTGIFIHVYQLNNAITFNRPFSIISSDGDFIPSGLTLTSRIPCGGIPGDNDANASIYFDGPLTAIQFQISGTCLIDGFALALSVPDVCQQTVCTSCTGPNLVVDPGFENFDPVTPDFFSSYDYTPCPGLCTNAATGQPILCQYDYSVNTTANSCNPDWPASIRDHTTGTGNMMIVDFPAGNVGANNNIWRQTVNLLPNKDYCFSAWFVNLMQDALANNEPIFRFAVNGTQIGLTSALPENLTWTNYGFTFNSGTGGSTQISIQNFNFGTTGFDLAIDDIKLVELLTQIPAEIEGDSLLCDGQTSTTLGLTDTYSSYRWSTGETTANISATAGITYSVTVTESNGCTSSDTFDVSRFVINATPATSTICAGGSVQLNTNLSGPGFTYVWTPTTGLSNPNIANPVATPGSNVTYTLTVSKPSSNLVVNGDFSLGNVGFTTSYNPGTGGPWGLLSNEGQYAINTNPRNTHNNFCTGGDNTTGSGNMLIANGASTAGTNVWCQTVNVAPNTTYNFAAWAMSVDPQNPADLQFSVNGVQIGSVVNLPTTTCQWQQFSAIWNSGNNTTANICILSQNIQQGGNDFALDDITFTGFCTTTDVVEVVVRPSFQLTASNIMSTCQGTCNGSINTSTTPSANYTYRWSNGGTASNATGLCVGFYSVTATDAQGCSVSINANIGNHPGFAINLGDVALPCVGDLGSMTASPSPSGSYSYLWNNGQTTATIGQLQPGSYSVTITDANGCTGSRIAAVNPGIDIQAYAGSDATIVAGETTALTATFGVQNPTFFWTTVPASQDTFRSNPMNVTPLQTTTYLLVASQGGCTSTDLVTVFVNQNGGVWVPNAFTPNGDSSNDGIKPVVEGAAIVTKFKIYNRWGRLLYEANDGTAWDGSFQNEVQPRDVYFFELQYKTSPLSTEVETGYGDFTLIR